jgi:hypothetical protein
VGLDDYVPRYARSKDENGAYKWLGTQGAEHGLGKATMTHSLCQWPECNLFSVYEIRRGECMGMIHLCAEHRRLFHKLSNYAVWKMWWQEKRKVNVREHLSV